MDAKPQPCPHQDDIWDCSICGAAHYGGDTWRTCRHGYLRGECPTCDRDNSDDKVKVDW